MRYLDHAATTPVLDEVIAVMVSYLRHGFGNPSSVYEVGRAAKKGVEQAREQVADAVGAHPAEIVFTGSGTEADDTALKGVAFKHRNRGNHIITCTTEHHAVLESADWLGKQGFDVTVVPVTTSGAIEMSALEDALRPDTVLVSVMLANNEVGTIQPIEQIVRLVKGTTGALVHTDAVQALGKIPVDLEHLGVDLASFSAHKLGGPKGTGALYVRRGTSIDPLIHGGGQERSLRSGTHNVAGIAGFGMAAQVAVDGLDEQMARLEKLRDRLQEELCAYISGVHVNGADAPRVPGTLNVCIEGIEGESLLLMLDSAGIAASSGSACTSGSLDPSHVLIAMGVDPQLALGSLRISLGRSSTEEDIDALTEVLPGIVEKIRSIPGRGR